MKNVIAVLIVLTGMFTGKLLAQEMGDKEKMKAFESWAGHWQGEGSIQMGPGEPRKSTVDERIEYKLDGMVVLIEGIGKAIDDATKKETIVHHALAVLSYDKISSQYKFKTYLKDGRSTNAWINVTAENNYQWGFDTPQGKIRYTIVMDPVKRTWNEIGQFSADGTNWQKFFEMNLKKVD
jgi:hypothetical protein